jgi:hypothetical protein
MLTAAHQADGRPLGIADHIWSIGQFVRCRDGATRLPKLVGPPSIRLSADNRMPSGPRLSAPLETSPCPPERRKGSTPDFLNGR